MPNPSIQALVDDTVVLINDEDATAYDNDKDWLPNAKLGLRTMLNLRPDLALGQYGTLVINDITLASLFPFDEQFIPPFRDFLVFMAGRKDGEWTDRGHAMAAYRFFKDYLQA